MSFQLPSEKQIQNVIVEWLRLHGALPIRINSGAVQATYKGRTRFMKFNSEPGCSDLLVCWPVGGSVDSLSSVFVAVEVKRPGSRTAKKQRIEQDAFRDKVIASGGFYYKVTSVDELKAVLIADGLLGKA